MKNIFEKVMKFFENRILILYIIVGLISVVFIVQLFNLQILNGKEYREQSEKRMLRTETVVASRGEITDRNGIVLASSKLSFDVDLYRVRVTTQEQNEALAKLINILVSNGDEIYSSFPINEELNDFSFENEDAEKKWKEEMEIDENFSFEQTISYYIDKYDLSEYSHDRNTQIRMIQIKYEGNLNGYSLFNSVTVAKDISQESVAQIEEKKSELYGVNVVSVPKRYYPNGTLAAHIIGYVSKISDTEYAEKKEEGYTINSIIGKTGIEQAFEKYLKGKDGVVKAETDSQGNVSSESTTEEAVAGNSIALTIDYRLQKTAEESIENVIKKLQDGTLVGKKVPEASAGSVVVLDIETGETLAMASFPSYNINDMVSGMSASELNKLFNDPLNPMYNRAISGTYAPGSTYKMLVGIAGLKANAITLDEKILDPGIYPYGHKPKCWIYTQYHRTHGYVNLEGAIKGSCNCYFYEVGRRIGIDEIIKTTKLFGLGQKTGIELYGESTGQIAGEKEEEWYLGDTLNAAIGQSSNLYTPIQLANYISAIANGGTLNKVSLIKNIKSSDDNEISLSEIEEFAKEFTGVDFESRDVGIEQSYVDAIKRGMLSVTSESGGTASIIFKNSNIQVAGKTGTSQVAGKQNNGIFVGFAPYDKPKIAVVAIIEGGGEGTYTANVVKPIMEEYFKISTEDKANDKEQNIVESSINF